MRSLEALPNELIARIVSFSNKESLMQLRLTDKRLESIAVRKLFETVTLYAHWANDGDAEEREGTDNIAPGSIIRGQNEYDIATRNTGTAGMTAMEEDEEDEFIPASDEEEGSSTTAQFQNQEQGQRRSRHTVDSMDEEDGDEFVAGSDMDEDDLAPTRDNERDHRPRTCCEGLRHEQRPVETSDRPPRPDPSSGRFSDFELFEKQRRQAWEASRPQWARANFPGPPDYDAIVFLNVLDSDRLREFVKKVEIYTCETHCNHHPKTASELYHGNWPIPNFHPRYHSSIKRLSEFSNACGLTVHFDRHAAYPLDDEFFQDYRFQNLNLEKIVHACGENITHVAVRHLANPQNQMDDGELNMPHFLHQVAAASSLRLSIKHVEVHPSDGTVYRNGAIQPFWDKFPAQILLPASNTLTTLALYSDIPLGWFPKLDLRGFHLPKLSSLTLGHHILHDERQVDWIISHQDTLRELIFDRCAILYQIGCAIPDWLDEDGYPKLEVDDFGEYGISADVVNEEDDDFDSLLCFKSNHLRWNAVFSRLASSLPRLHEFRFGTSQQWDFNTKTTRFRAGATTHMPIVPWEDEHNIESKLFEERYVIWDDWQNEYRPTWDKKDRHGRREFGVDWRSEWLARLDAYPDCEKEDEAALRELLDISKGRW